MKGLRNSAKVSRPENGILSSFADFKAITLEKILDICFAFIKEPFRLAYLSIPNMATLVALISVWSLIIMWGGQFNQK